ncbi:hypothetical protein C5E24_06745 [Pectobacterium parmentieri]|uniref:hypothetical protein n=1 Tax=Pectobacterium parmentieri TaxID=1905730 RepID=UPI000EB3F819|nr:hypothetical protein [Pectobacterium parmentieri]AYH09407.1 hypothetical protein C5E24_06745 [Pectobacterium parmentieri]
MENEIELQEVIAHIQPIKDVALSHLAFMANLGAGFSLTLLVDGQVIFGDIISGKDYCDEMHKQFANSSGDKNIGEVIGKFFLQLKDSSYVKENSSEIPLNFIHLKNISYLKGDGGQLHMNGSILRVTLDKVSAFSLGRPE